MLNLEPHELSHLLLVPKLPDQLQVGQVAHIVLEGCQDEVEQPVRVNLEVSNKLLHVLLDLRETRFVDVVLI